MATIRDTLGQFLAETGQGDRRSLSSPFMIIDLFGKYLDEYGHEDLSSFERARFDKEWREDKRFGDIFGPDHVQPFHLNSFLSTFVIRKVMGTKDFLKACGPMMERLASWLVEKGYWDSKAMTYFRRLVGKKAGADLAACEAFGRALWEYVDGHPNDAPDELDDHDHLDDEFTIKQVEPGKMILEGLLEGDDDIPISLPKSVTGKARTGWSVTLEMARVKGKWRILGVGNVYP